jgi:hypothetical protein
MKEASKGKHKKGKRKKGHKYKKTTTEERM